MRLSGNRFRALVVCLAALGCDTGGRMPDAQTQPAAYSAELLVRFEVTPDKPATATVLGFRAAAAGPEADVLGLVDPLAAAAPDQGCVLRDADLANRALVTRGSSVDLEELGGVGVGLGASGTPMTVIRPFPRVYPDVAGVLGGVVAEAGPLPITALPEHVSLYTADSELPIVELNVPVLPRLRAINGAAPVSGARVDASGGLTLALTAPAGAIVELRPFGSTLAVTCSMPANSSTEGLLVIPRSLLAHLQAPDATGSGRPMSLEVARRIQTREPLLTRGTRISVEVRSALAVELRP
jgi:hypothetical protein